MQTRAYRSKIGRLPWELRVEVCERMRDGATAARLCKWLAGRDDVSARLRECGMDGISPQNLSDWRKTGYQDWLRDQQKVDHIRKLSTLSESIVAAAGGDPAAVGSRILIGRILDILSAAGGQVPIDELTKAVAVLRSGETEAARVGVLKDVAALKHKQVDIAERTHELNQARFRRQTCEMFIKWAADRQALDIAAGPGTNDERVKAMLAYMEAEERKEETDT